MTITEISAALEAMTRLSRYLMADVSKAGQLSNNQIVACKALLPIWKAGETVDAGDCRAYQDRAYRCRQAHPTQADWTPDVTPAMWEVIDITHAGTLDDPIPAALNMEYFEGRYYSEGGKLYYCTRSTGQAVAYLPSALVGQYFEEVL